MYLQDTTPSEIHVIIRELNNKSTSDTSVIALKSAIKSNNICNILSDLINDFFKEGIFPDELKLRKSRTYI